MALTFNARNHTYRLDGKPVPGVTTLIGKGIPKPAIPYWAARTVAEFVADNRPDVESMWDKGRGPMVAYLKETPWQRRDAAAARGTEVHTLGERLVHGEEVDVPEHLAGIVRGYADWLDTHTVRPILTERAVASRQWWYAGMFDLLAEVDGVVCLLDLKTSSGIYGETALQLAAYGAAEFYLADDGTETPLPQVERQGALHICEGETVAYWSTDPAGAFKDFTHAAWTARAADRIKTYMCQENAT